MLRGEIDNYKWEKWLDDRGVSTKIGRCQHQHYWQVGNCKNKLKCGICLDIRDVKNEFCDPLPLKRKPPTCDVCEVRFKCWTDK